MDADGVRIWQYLLPKNVYMFVSTYKRGLFSQKGDSMGSSNIDGMITLGGVSVREVDIKQRNLVIDAKTGKKKFVIDFKNGTRVAYAESKGGILLSSGDSVNGDKYTNTHVAGVKGLEIKGTPGKDAIYVEDCTITEINVLGNGSDLVQVKNSKGTFGTGNFISDFELGTVRADRQKDEVILENSKTVFVQNE